MTITESDFDNRFLLMYSILYCVNISMTKDLNAKTPPQQQIRHYWRVNPYNPITFPPQSHQNDLRIRNDDVRIPQNHIHVVEEC